jgi:hypothetical protein
VLAAALLALVGVVAACGPATPSFSAGGPCVVDGRTPGTYPALEALLPLGLIERSPDKRDSGRSCSNMALGTLVSHDVHDLRFAGATWDNGGGKATTIAVLALPGRDLPVAWAEEFYEIGARTARRTDLIETTRPTIAGITVFRLDTLNDLSFQTVLVWPDGPIARVVLVATPVSAATSRKMHDGRVEEAAGVAASMPPAPASFPPG